MLCKDKFYEIYKKNPVSVALCPDRVCPIGAHSDHQLKKITGFAIDKGIHIAHSRKRNGVIELGSLHEDISSVFTGEKDFLHHAI